MHLVGKVAGPHEEKIRFSSEPGNVKERQILVNLVSSNKQTMSIKALEIKEKDLVAKRGK